MGEKHSGELHADGCILSTCKTCLLKNNFPSANKPYCLFKNLISDEFYFCGIKLFLTETMLVEFENVFLFLPMVGFTVPV